MTHSSEQVRSAFLAFFRERGHEVVASGPVIAPNDPTLMFANAGMVQFKDVFTGRETRPYRRAATSQKCIRISGKHNDLENVGPSPRHHTFFEMLGNFSFGDYFKEEAIVYAWDFIRELGLPRERLVFTYFAGEDGIPADTTARDLWRKVAGVSEQQIIGLGKEENFWSMGDVGPCGPCSEIHFFLGPNPDLGRFGEEQTPEGFGFMEIWNLVFMQFERRSDGTFVTLPKPSIDTGMGLERITCVLQGKSSNYETDLLRALVDKAASLSGKTYGAGMTPNDVSMRVIADHARLAAFCLAEGVMPDSNGREYVLRRVMRRAIRHGHRLGIAKPFLHEVAIEVTRSMGGQYPELLEKRSHIASVCEQEEVRFRRTIERGLGLLDERFTELEKQRTRVLAGADAFKLYDTYGFPLDLTEVICRERDFTVDLPGYERALEQARERSEFKGVESAVEGVYREALTRVPAAEVRFSGYDTATEESALVAIVAGGRLLDRSSAGDAPEQVELVFESTPFYGESGGQVGDTGTITTPTTEFVVEDTQRPIPGLVVHRGKFLRGALAVGERARLVVDERRRNAIRRNHSATHLLHWALRQVLGSHAQQKGSLVGPERLRFDFTHGQPLTKEELTAIENLANQAILANTKVGVETLPMEEAKRRGAMMLFGEKYGERVRVLSMGDSVELCGGTHAHATGDIGLLKITAEQGVAAGVRRLVATSGEGSLHYLRELESTLERAASLVKASPSDLPSRLEKVLANEKALQKKLNETQKKLTSGEAGGGLDGLLSQAREIHGIKVLSTRTPVSDRGALRELAEQLRDRLGSSVVLVASVAEDKAQLVLTVAKPLTARLPAGQLIRPIAEMLGGSGGGRPDLAQAGGTQLDRLDEALAALYAIVEPGAAAQA